MTRQQLSNQRSIVYSRTLVAVVWALISPATARPAPQRSVPPMDTARAAMLYVGTREDEGVRGDFASDSGRRAFADSVYAARARGTMRFLKVSYRSTHDGLPIPARVFAPQYLRGGRGHAAMVWVHGGVHGQWPETMVSFVQEAVARGYVIICPEFRGSTGITQQHFDAIDYGGAELDDVRDAARYLESLPYVDPARIGIIGWSHGGYIAARLAFQRNGPFRAAASVVPVVNLVHRLSLKGPAYQRLFAPQAAYGGLPFENPDTYVNRSLLASVDSLDIPFLLHVATNDGDVDYSESRPLVDALLARKSQLAEVRVYEAPRGGHAFNQLVEPTSLSAAGSPHQRDSWNRIWVFFEWWLRPYAGR